MEQHSHFNLGVYEDTLRAALDSGYCFRPFDCLNEKIEREDKICLLRHDIDADVQAALEMARLEHSLGIKSTYFFMLRSPVYNLMSRANNDFAMEIVKLGHYVGLHYDHSYCASTCKLEHEWIAFEASVIEDILDTTISTVSFHQPARNVLDGNVEMGNFLNTYTDPKDEGFHYMSDSNRVWLNEDALSVFLSEKHRKLQLLIHPFWWVYGHCMSTEDAWDHTISVNLGHMQKQLVETERAYGEEREFLFKHQGARQGT